MFRDKLTAKYTVYLFTNGEPLQRVAIIDAPSLQAATNYATRTYGENVRVNQLSRP